MTKDMAVMPGNKRRVQVRKVREGGFCEEKRQVFLDHLAGCCNVTRAAAAAGVSAVTVNYHRRRDPVFAQQCAEAIEVGYDGLEAMLVERAAGGGHYVPGDTIVPGPESVDAALALHLLSLRRKAPGRRTGNAGYAPKRASETELNEAILAKLDVLARRLKQGKARRGRAAGDDSDRRTPSPQPSPQPSPPKGEGATPRSR